MNQLVPLRDVAERIDYGFTTSATVAGDGPKFLRITDIDKSHVDWNTVPTCNATSEEIAKYSLESGDIVVARTGASTGRSQWVQVQSTTVFASYLVRFRISKDFNSRFIGYVLNSSPWLDYVSSVAHGKSAQPNMSAASMADFMFECPPLTQQVAIAEVLGALDDKIAANTKLAKTADELAGKLFDHAAALLPTQPLSSILTPILGGTPSRSNLGFWDGEELWASARDITGAPFSVVLDTEEKITSAAVEKTKAKPLPAGGVILTARGTVGAVARLATPASFNQSCYGFLPESLPPSLLYFSVLRATAQAKALVHGSVFDTITKRTFDHVLIPEFGEAADSVEDQISPFLDLVTASVRENATLAATRDALLPQLMSGKLRVKDAEKVLESAL